MIEFLDAIADSFAGRLLVFLFVGGWLTLGASSVVYVSTDDEFGEGGMFTGILMVGVSVVLFLLWVMLRMLAWVFTGE